ncbi:arsenate reductase ArsC [Candidatus Neomarinimicrobiota bacterium]
MSNKILILCTGNSCRSQMAEGMFKSFDSTLEVCSAGTQPTKNVHPIAVKVMNEIGINIHDYIPKNVDTFVNQQFDYLITVCDHAKETCPVFTGTVKNRLHMGFNDPAAFVGSIRERDDFFRKVRDQIKHDFFEFYNRTLKSEEHNI